MDPGTDLEDELPTPVGSPSTDVSKPVPGSTSSGVYLELALALLELGVLPAMAVVDSVPLGVASPARPAGGSPARDESLLCQVSPPDSVAEAVLSPVLQSTDVDSPPSGLAAMDQYLSWSASLPAVHYYHVIVMHM